MNAQCSYYINVKTYNSFPIHKLLNLKLNELFVVIADTKNILCFKV
jgi:hypothetical protein